MVGLLLSLHLAHAAPVLCDPLSASEILAEARIEERRAPVSHPELIPGLALASARTDAELRAALGEWCAGEATLSLARAETWESAGWSAHTFLLTRSETVDCTLFQRTLALSVAVSPDTAPRYSLRSRLPYTRTPVGDCPTLPTWREETLIDGAESPVRLVVATDLEGGRVVHSEVLVRRASPEGWSEQTLWEPAPERLLGGTSGPTFELTSAEDEKWVVLHGDRSGEPPDCAPVPGQVVWTWAPDGWLPHRGREAVAILAQRGLWRYAGEDGWLVILAQGEEDEAELVASRARRMGKKSPEPLHTLPSAWFPGLNPGFVIVVPGPFPTREEAEQARRKVRGWQRGYVKKAWTAEDPCAR